MSPSTLTVAAGQRGTATVTMRVNPRALRHTIDPTMDDDPARVSPGSTSRTPRGACSSGPPAGQAARVPVYGAAKPVSTTRAAVSKRRIDLTGAGFSQGSGSTAWRSYASVLQLGATSGRLPACEPEQTSGCADSQTERAGDLRYVGAGSSGDWLWFGLSTYAEWPKIGTLFSPYVDYRHHGRPAGRLRDLRDHRGRHRRAARRHGRPRRLRRSSTSSRSTSATATSTPTSSTATC